MTDTANVPKGGMVLLISGGPLANIVANGLSARLGSITIIEETPKRRGRSFVPPRPPARLADRARSSRLRPCAALALAEFRPHRRHLDSARSRSVAAAQPHDPSRRIGELARMPRAADQARSLRRGGLRHPHLERATLAAIDAPFINYHAGINPKYRGQHPGYWALASDDAENAGVTIHLVDEGVDTGSVLYQDARHIRA